MLLAQMVVSPIVNFALLAPIFAPPGFLEQSAAHANAISIAAVLGIASGALSVGIAIAAWPVFRRHSEAMALWLFAIGVAALVANMVEQSQTLAMLSLGKAYAAANGVDTDIFRRIGAQVGSARYMAHLLGLVGGGSLAFVLYGTSFRFALVPRWLAGAGIVAALLEIVSVSLPFFGQSIVFPLLAPLGLCHLAFVIWLFVRGFADRPATPGRVGTRLSSRPCTLPRSREAARPGLDAGLAARAVHARVFVRGLAAARARLEIGLRLAGDPHARARPRRDVRVRIFEQWPKRLPAWLARWVLQVSAS